MSDMSFQDYHLTLYVAAGSPSAAAAIGALSAVLPSVGFSIGAVRIVDVLREPGEALSAGLSITPTLMVANGGQMEWFVGDFGHSDRLRHWVQSTFDDKLPLDPSLRTIEAKHQAS